MAQAADNFSDILLPGEAVLATLGGPGPTAERAFGPERSWFQVAVTPTRLLMVRMVQSQVTLQYTPQQRLAAGKELTRIRRFPRTPASSARLEIYGCGDPIVIYDIDDPNIFPYVEPFLAAWGGAVEGGGELKVRAVDPNYEGPARDNKQLLIFAGAVAAILFLCCGCAGFGGVMRFYVLPYLDS